MTTEAPKAPTPAEATIKAAYLEELRFAKRQQWTITAAVVGLAGGVYTIAKSLAPWERAIATILVVVAVIAGIYWLFDLQRHLRNTRLRVDPYDRGARRRSLEIVYGMAGAMILSAVVVCYLFWRDEVLRIVG